MHIPFNTSNCSNKIQSIAFRQLYWYDLIWNQIWLHFCKLLNTQAKDGMRQQFSFQCFLLLFLSLMWRSEDMIQICYNTLLTGFISCQLPTTEKRVYPQLICQHFLLCLVKYEIYKKKCALSIRQRISLTFFKSGLDNTGHSELVLHSCKSQ